MATRRLTVSSVDWAEFASKIPAAQRASFNALKNKQDGYVKTIASLPAELPKIDFNFYRDKITVKNMVDTFEKEYNGLKVPYPKDSMSATLESQAAEAKANYEKVLAESKTRLDGFATELAKWEAMKCPSEMLKEERLEKCPETLIVNPNIVSYWPHDESIEEWEKKMAEMEDEHH